MACQQGTLTLPDTWFRPPFWDLLMLQLLRPNSSKLPCLYSTFHLEHPLVLSRFCLISVGGAKRVVHSIYSIGIMLLSTLHILHYMYHENINDHYPCNISTNRPVHCYNHVLMNVYSSVVLLLLILITWKYLLRWNH